MNVHFSSKTNEWATPQEFFDELHREFNFTLDPCATERNAKCRKYFTQSDNGLSQSWDNESVFCNPPYGREIGLWVKKASEAREGVVVMLIPARTDTKWFHDYIYNKAEIRFIKGRLKFGNSKNSAPFPSMIVVFK
jgi:site-specific DNA-methyltransferase (adenine-specific)